MIITPTGFRIVLRAKLDGSNRFYTRMQISEQHLLSFSKPNLKYVPVFAFAFDFVESLGLSGLKKVESQAIFMSPK